MAERLPATLNLDQKFEKINEFPLEILEIIFLKLSIAQLLQIQLVCRRWRDIVRSSRKLMNRFMFKFPHNTIMDRDYVPECLNPDATRFSFRSARIFSVPAWWEVFGERLVQLDMIESEIMCSTFEHMLKFTPNLKTLNLAVGEKVIFTRDMSITPMYRLCFDYGEPHLTFINTLSNLESLYLDCGLEDFNFTGCRSSSLKRLYIKLCMLHNNSLPEFLNGCPNLSSIALDNVILDNWTDVYTALANLKGLKVLQITFMRVFFKDNWTPTAPTNDLKQLEQLHCEMPKPMMAALFGKCPQLKSARLSGFGVDDEVVMQLCQHAKKLNLLSIAYADSITNTIANHVAEQLTDLRELRIANCSKITNEVKEKLGPYERIKVTIKMRD